MSDIVRFYPIALVLTLGFGISAVYLFGYLLPSKDYTKSFIFGGLFTMTAICYVLSLTTPAGSIPDSKEWEYAENASTTVETAELKRNGRRRHCKWCAKFKPDRCHHCRVCKSCVLRMDHHCPWILNCVGFHNHKYFFLLVLYACVTCAMVAVDLAEAWAHIAVLNPPPQIYSGQYTLLSATCAVSALLAGVLGAFFAFHGYLMISAMTTIEYCEKKRSGGYDSTLYDRGLWTNLRYVLGPNPLLWLFPVRTQIGDGLVFKMVGSSSGNSQGKEEQRSAARQRLAQKQSEYGTTAPELLP